MVYLFYSCSGDKEAETLQTLCNFLLDFNLSII